MRGALFKGNRQLEVTEFPDPTPGPGEVVIEIKASGMCGSDLGAERLALAGQFGAAATVDASQADVVEALQSLSRGRGVDYALDCSGSPQARVAAVRELAPGARFVLSAKAMNSHSMSVAI